MTELHPYEVEFLTSAPATVALNLALSAQTIAVGQHFTPRFLAAKFTVTTDVCIHEVHEPDAIGLQFKYLHAAWKNETGTPRADLRIILNNWAYLRIISLGMRIVPFILEDMVRKPDHWGKALQAITGVNPVPPEMAGNLPAIATAWREWGKRHLLVS